MAKINVYLPDDLEREVRAADLAVSAICQSALRDAVDTVRAAGAGDATGGRFTPRLATIVEDAKARAVAAGGKVTPRELLTSIVEHGENMGARVLQSLGVDLPSPRPVRAGSGAGELTADTRAVLGAARRTALELRHPHVGTEHVVIALAELDPDLRDLFGALGITESSMRRQVERLLANPWTTERTVAEPDPALLERLDLEVQRLAAELGRLRAPDDDG